MRRFIPLAVVAVLATAAPASAVTNTLSLSARMQMLSTPSPTAPAPVSYEWIQDVGTSPAGLQPNATSSFELFFPKQVVSNAAYFPTCTAAQLEGAASVPASCVPAIVGNGLAVAYTGPSGWPIANSYREPMRVTLLNGSPAGQRWILYFESEPGAPLYVRTANSGVVQASSDPYGFSVRWEIPVGRQYYYSLPVTLTKVVVNIPSQVRPVTVNETTYDASFLRMASCEGSLPALDRVSFGADLYPAGPSPGVLEAATAVVCEVGPGLPYYPPYSPPGTYPQYPPLPGTEGGAGTQGGAGPAPEAPPEVPPGPQTGVPPGPPLQPPRPAIRGPKTTKTVTVSRTGAFTLPRVTVVCPSAGGGCVVDVVATKASWASGARVLARAHFKLSAGRASAVSLKLTKAGRKALARKRGLKLNVRLTVRGAGGARATRTIKAKIRAPKPVRRH